MIDMNLGDTQLILSECKRAGLSVKHTAYVLATAKWETNHTMKPVREAYWLSEDWRRKNCVTSLGMAGAMCSLRGKKTIRLRVASWGWT